MKEFFKSGKYFSRQRQTPNYTEYIFMLLPSDSENTRKTLEASVKLSENYSTVVGNQGMSQKTI